MRYHYSKPDKYSSMYGKIYVCNHPLYNSCTLYQIGSRGLSVIQQRFDSETKCTWWGEIDPWLNDQLYMHENFYTFFNKRADICVDGLYPTVTIRQFMWFLKLKPLKRKRWETVFDRKII